MNILKSRTNIITYTVDKKVNNNLYISVQNGEVVVNAPWYLSNNQIQEVVEQKHRWIVEKLKEYEENKKQNTKIRKVKILGEEFHVKINYSNTKIPELKAQEKEIQINLPGKYKKMNNKEVSNKIIEKMYKVIAEQEVEQLMEKTRIKMGMMPEDYEIVKMDKILAKCNDNKIQIDCNIAMYSKEVIEYVIVHEFCHLKYKNHTKSFYDMVKRYIPNYEKYACEINNMQY